MVRAAIQLFGLPATMVEEIVLETFVMAHGRGEDLRTPALAKAHLCMLALRVADTLKQTDGGRASATLSRVDKWAAQTPQMFRLGELRDALRAAGTAVTDDASAIEAQGLRPLLVEGDSENLKVTWPSDFMLAERVLAARAKGNP